MSFQIGDKVKVVRYCGRTEKSSPNSPIGEIGIITGNKDSDRDFWLVTIGGKSPWYCIDSELELVPGLTVGDRVITPSGAHGTIIPRCVVEVKTDDGQVERFFQNELSPEPEDKEFFVSCEVYSSAQSPEEAAVMFVQSIVDIHNDMCPLNVQVKHKDGSITDVNIIRDPDHNWVFGCKVSK